MIFSENRYQLFPDHAATIEPNSRAGEKVPRAPARLRGFICVMQFEAVSKEIPQALRPAPAPRRIPFRYDRLTIVRWPLGDTQWDKVGAFVRQTERDDLRRRFGYPLAFDDELTLRRAFGIKTGGEMLWSLDQDGAIAGICHRVLISPQEAEIALIVRSDLKGFGIGEFLLRTVLKHAARQGLKALHASVLRDNTPMLRLAMKVGCMFTDAHDEAVEIAFNVGQTA
jgi:RimJ/RimL family protein N-acetyltransferase